VEQKVAELSAAMEDIPFVRASRIDEDVSSRTFPFRRTDFADKRLKPAAPVLYNDGVNPNLRCCGIVFAKSSSSRRSLSALR